MMKIRVAIVIAGACLAGPALAKKRVETGTPVQMQRLLACRTMTDAAQRLACFDRESAGVGQALASKDLVVIDRERSREARRSLFGFSVPDFGGLFGGEDGDDIKQIEGKVASATYRGVYGWSISLQDGSIWSQTDETAVPIEPRKGDKVVVKRGALGSFRLSVNGQPGIKVKRVG